MAHTMKPQSSIKSGARFHVPNRLGPGVELVLPHEAGHHAARVLRLPVGASIILFDGSGGEHEAVITRIHRNEVGAKIVAGHGISRESPVPVTLVQGISSGDRMELTIRKSVELGVHRIVPVFTERGIVKLRDERADRRRQHWQALAVSACEQCGRNVVPLVTDTADFRQWLADLPPPAPGETRLALAVEGERRLVALPRPAGDVTLLVGPEGGLSREESALAATRGFEAVRLGPRVLRTETAALVALAAIQTLWGDF